jgi:hypothetical protein
MEASKAFLLSFTKLLILFYLLVFLSLDKSFEIQLIQDAVKSFRPLSWHVVDLKFDFLILG